MPHTVNNIVAFVPLVNEKAIVNYALKAFDWFQTFLLCILIFQWSLLSLYKTKVHPETKPYYRPAFDLKR